jgi:hypothetical protein
MRPISIVCLLLLLDWEAVAQAPQPTDTAKTTNKEKCTVAGTVARLDSGAPLKKATVVLSSNESRGKSVFAMTDDQGHFEFDNVEAGSYGLNASHNGFVTSLYGQKKPDNPGANLTLAPGQKMIDLVFRLLRSASISGHVMDEDGEPLPNVQVIPYHASSQRGRSGLGAVGEALTNDLGEYRIFGLNPGRYYIRANYQPQRNLLGNPSPTRISKEAYPPTFYPGTTDPAKAAAIIVKAGDEIPALDFILKPSPVVAVTGKVSNAATDQSGFLSLGVALIPRGMIFSGDDAILHTEVSNKMGVFEFRDVFPGSYIVRAWGITNQERFSAQRELDVGVSDVEGVNLTITRGAEVPGRIIWEGQPITEVQEVHVTLWTVDDSPYSPNVGAFQATKADGSFLIKNVPEGVYRPRVFTRNPDCFVRSARYGPAEVVDGGLAVHPGTDASLELKMSCRAAQIEGTVVTVDSLPAAGVYVVAIPDAPHRDQQWRYRSETTDQNGKFLLRGLLPGEYRIFSWDSGDDFDWYNADQLKPYESKGVSVSVQEGDRKTVQLTAITTDVTPQPIQ